LPLAGNWHRLACGPPGDDLLEMEELKKDRARLLLDRYGIVFRELLQREAPGFRWSDVFRSLRLMELAGEVLAGCFFSGVPGLQFASHKAFRMLQRKLPDDAIYWINAADPASLCGLPLDPIRGSLPRRLPGTHLVYHGCRLVLVSERTGRELTFRVPPDAPRMREYLGVLFHLLARESHPLRQITIETINGEEAARSAFVDPLRSLFDVTIDYRNVVLHRRLQ
jgi:ATP-dependent Lhr-like helicase